ncbi:hypothetical protein [Euzebyella saccharophila]|uniref:Outer membrane protein beta-barrel domain-containing protein n=1 Tax=Euzebyella saccharophila TaxID=679664 RepID=A0ABV8JJS7_9FLAO|nr:hypothetical protein [Euzebyella saccharophila]
MKKTLLFLSVMFCFTSLVKAQEFQVGTNAINVGVGVGGYYYGYNVSDQSPVFSVSYERGVWDVPGPGVVSLGGYLGHKRFSRNDNFDDYNWSYTTVGFRGAYHYTGFEIDNLDVYGGAMLSYRVYGGDDYEDYRSRPGASAYAGGRWYFNEHIAAFAEIGYGSAYLTLGATFRF